MLPAELLPASEALRNDLRDSGCIAQEAFKRKTMVIDYATSNHPSSYS